MKMVLPEKISLRSDDMKNTMEHAELVLQETVKRMIEADSAESAVTLRIKMKRDMDSDLVTILTEVTAGIQMKHKAEIPYGGWGKKRIVRCGDEFYTVPGDVAENQITFDELEALEND